MIKPIPTKRLRLGAVVWAHVPFEEQHGHKTRPAVIVAADRHSALLLPASTSPTRFRFPRRYLELTDLARAGLDRASGVHLRPTAVERLDLVDVCGELGDEDLDALAERYDLAAADLQLEAAHAA